MNKRPAVFQEGLRGQKNVDVLGFGMYNGGSRVIVEQADGRIFLAELQDVRFTDKGMTTSIARRQGPRSFR